MAWDETAAEMSERIRSDRIGQGLGGTADQVEAMVAAARALVEGRVEPEKVPAAILRAAVGLWTSYVFGLHPDRYRRLEFERDSSDGGEALLSSDRLVSISSHARHRSFWTECGAGELLAPYVRRGALIARHSRSS